MGTDPRAHSFSRHDTPGDDTELRSDPADVDSIGTTAEEPADSGDRDGPGPDEYQPL